MIGGSSKRSPDFKAINSNLSSIRLELSQLRNEIDAIKTAQLAGQANEEQDSNIFIVPKTPDTGELRRRRYYLHEQISDKFSQSELVSLMYSMGVDPGDVPGESHNDMCLQFVMYCERHEKMQYLLERLQRERPRSKWKL